MRQADTLPARPVEQQRILRREPNENILRRGPVHCAWRQRGKPLGVISQFQQQHRLLMHGRDRKDSRADRIVAGRAGNREMLGPNSEPAWAIRRRPVGSTEPDPCARNYREQRAMLLERLDLGEIDGRIAEQSRDRASLNMQFEEAARLHQRVERIAEVQSSSGDLARALPSLAGIAVTPSAVADAVDLWFLLGGVWREPHRLSLSEDSGAGRSLDHRLHEIVEQMKSQTQHEPARAPVMEHLSILTRWHHATWRDGEWIEIDWPAKIPYRKLVNAIGRVGRPAQNADPQKDKATKPTQKLKT